ncbi:hypothetical protein ACO0LG_08710 [Undibacterium sp. Ji42W]|uniref:hypothetical protein n=1 Tax=Undibacterium sp. Ji42W TaxID=3413039 RepID=UPI003BF17E6B
MAAYGRLAGVMSDTTVQQLYRVPNTVNSASFLVNFCNQSLTTEGTVAIAISDVASPVSADWFLMNKLIGITGDPVTFTGLAAGAGQYVFIQCSTNTVSVNLDGYAE